MRTQNRMSKRNCFFTWKCTTVFLSSSCYDALSYSLAFINKALGFNGSRESNRWPFLSQPMCSSIPTYRTLTQISREESKEHFEVKDLQLLSVSWNCHGLTLCPLCFFAPLFVFTSFACSANLSNIYGLKAFAMTCSITKVLSHYP